jgi:cellulose synthase/poly-beta-1,6-N-acetylglucosamine synthase-like glycosyltransferase
MNTQTLLLQSQATLGTLTGRQRVSGEEGPWHHATGAERKRDITLSPKGDGRLTIIVPAYNEAQSIADTVKSLQSQSRPPERILVVDDCSTDATAAIARSCGAEVLRPPVNTGSKAGAQTYALGFVDSEFTMAIDADTILAPDAIEIICAAMDEPRIAAACGLVLPRFVKSVWERGRYVEYLLAFNFYKPIQDYYERPLISSGCFSIYRTAVLRSIGGWSTRTMAEDMDLTWTLYQRGEGVRFVPEAVSFPIEPHDFGFLSKQLRRWSHGFIQNVALHWRGILQDRFLSTMVAVAIFDATVASIAYLICVPLFALLISPWFLMAYLVDIPVVAVPVLVKGASRGELQKSLASIPAFLVLRLVNGLFMLRALWSEIVLGRSLKVYEKGH